jgi:uncharacterized protein
LRAVNAADYVSASIGLPTVTYIISELDKPGRDPRPEFKTAKLQDGVEKLSDLEPDMILEGTVTNVTNFGAFVDVGVHQDGLVHISVMSNKFIKDPHEVAKAGDIVKVKVMEIDQDRKRIALSMRLEDKAGEQAPKNSRGKNGPNSRGNDKPRRQQQPKSNEPKPNNAFAQAFAKAKK